jgi:hypothetical protein
VTKTQLTRGKHEKCQSIVAEGTASCFACIRVYFFADSVDWPVLDFQGCTDSRKVASCCLVRLSSRGRLLKVNLFPGATTCPRCYQDIGSLILNADFIKSLKARFRLFFQAIMERLPDQLSRSQPLISTKMN